MRYILIDEERRDNAVRHLRTTKIKPTLVVDIKEYKKNRSNSQNNLYHMWKKHICDYTGQTKEELHKELKVRFLGVEKTIVQGIELIEPKSTKRLDVKEFAEFLNKVEMLARHLGVILPYPDDYKYAIDG